MCAVNELRTTGARLRLEDGSPDPRDAQDYQDAAAAAAASGSDAQDEDEDNADDLSAEFAGGAAEFGTNEDAAAIAFNEGEELKSDEMLDKGKAPPVLHQRPQSPTP